MIDWGISEVGTWLDSIGCGEYKEVFSQHDIRGPELIALEKTDLHVCLYLFHYFSFLFWQNLKNLSSQTNQLGFYFLHFTFKVLVIGYELKYLGHRSYSVHAQRTEILAN